MNGEQSRQSRVNREQNDINANNCRTVNSRQFTHNSSLSTVHSLAFTLAETLIVMGIIGVVAALTIPNVNKNTGEAETVAKVKKIYAELNEALDRATAVYGPLKTWFVNDSTNAQKTKRFADRITEFMKIQKDCKNSTGCFTKTYYTHLDGTNANTSCNLIGLFNSYQTKILSNGVSIGFEIWSSGTYIDIIIDVDGPNKGKHTYGIDTFRFRITDINSGKIVNYADRFYTNSINSLDYPASWILNNGNMDYLMIKDRSTPEKSRTCPNGKKLGYNTAAGDVSSCK